MADLTFRPYRKRPDAPICQLMKATRQFGPVFWRNWQMSTPRKTFFATLGTFADVFGSAAAVSNAVEAGRAPKAKHLRTLGIDPGAFRSIGKL
ncbi:hypothetical protein ASD80_09875 [Devosia sp. Root635]|nr:hypothetical protein ASD80_09875 [Devosia sp. Root635]